MKIIATLKDTDFGLDVADNMPVTRERSAVRAILIDEKKRVCLVYARVGNFYKIPGGGVQEGESNETALKREVIEEVGYECEIVCEIGRIVEFRQQNPAYDAGFTQISDCYLVRAGKFVGSNLMEDEQGDGFEAVWFDDIDAAIEAIEIVQPKSTKYSNLYEIKFFEMREFTFLKAAKKLLAKPGLL